MPLALPAQRPANNDDLLDIEPVGGIGRPQWMVHHRQAIGDLGAGALVVIQESDHLGPVPGIALAGNGYAVLVAPSDQDSAQPRPRPSCRWMIRRQTNRLPISSAMLPSHAIMSQERETNGGPPRK